ncbi:hypothetical protein M1349_02880 [Patescibacteria group bacterium]|nr:hypothetical protein [Patescibacteria group bacterium]
MKTLPKTSFNKKLKSSLLVFSITVFTFTFLALSLKIASAQYLKSLTITPPAVEKAVSPGDRVEGELKIINDGDMPLSFNVEVQDYIVVDSNGTPNLLPLNTLNSKYSAAAWLGVNPTIVTVEPHKRQVFNYYLQVPDDAKPGGHYAAVVYKPVEEKTKGTGTSVNGVMANLFYITVKGDVKEEASITKFLANLFNEYGPVSIKAQIKNSGDLHIKPKGSVTVTDLLGRKSQVALSERNIFPGGGLRDYEETVGSKWMFGPYTAKLAATYGQKNNLPLNATVTFWVLPWKIGLLIVLIIVLVVLGKMYLDKAKTQNGHKEDKKPEETKETVATDETTPSQE